MKKAGRASLLSIFAVVALVAAAALLTWSFIAVTPKTVGSQFMTALATGDVDTLTDLTYMEDASKDEIRRQWEFATQVAGKHYEFHWKLVKSNEPDGNNAGVRFDITRNWRNLGAYPEKYDLSLIKHEGRWLVDVRTIDRSLFPALPR